MLRSLPDSERASNCCIRSVRNRCHGGGAAVVVVVGATVVEVVVVVGATVVVVAGAPERCHIRRFPIVVHLKEPADVFRICPIFLHVIPPIEAACAALGDTAAGNGFRASGSGTATGSIPVNAAAPTEIVWHTMHICTANGT